MKINKTAILVFANSAEKELKLKSIQSASVFELLNFEVLKTVKKTGLPYFHFSEKEQIGASFGERFSNAIQAIYNKGFNTVISVGNDTPHLKASHILKAKQKLESSDYVFGPSTDGGFYLMGFKKTHFKKTQFEALPWQTSKLQYVLRKNLNGKKRDVFYLETLSDIDTVSDIDVILNSFKALVFKLKALLISIRKIDSHSSAPVKYRLNNIYFKIHQNKGSPILRPI